MGSYINNVQTFERLNVPTHRAERVGFLSAAYKIPQAALSAGLNKSGDRSVKVQGLCI